VGVAARRASPRGGRDRDRPPVPVRLERRRSIAPRDLLSRCFWEGSVRDGGNRVTITGSRAVNPPGERALLSHRSLCSRRHQHRTAPQTATRLPNRLARFARGSLRSPLASRLSLLTAPNGRRSLKPRRSLRSRLAPLEPRAAYENLARRRLAASLSFGTLTVPFGHRSHRGSHSVHGSCLPVHIETSQRSASHRSSLAPLDGARHRL